MVTMEISKYLFPYLFLNLCIAEIYSSNGENMVVPFHVGVVLDLGTLVGKMGRTSIAMAIDDFYSVNGNHTTRVILHTRDSNNDVVQAAASALDLLENKQVQAIIGPQKSAQAMFLSEIANKFHVPLLSFVATSPSLSSINTAYFIRTSLDDSYQLNGPLTSIIKAFGWRKVVPIYEDTEYGRGILPGLVDTLHGIGTYISYRSVIPPSPSDDQIRGELYKLMTMDSQVFIVHMTAPIGARLFMKAKEIGMMSQGFVWIMTHGLSSVVDSLDPSVIESMQGSLGMKLYVPRSKKLDDFSTRWRRRFQQENPNDQPAEPSIFELWAYDTAWLLAIAAQKVGSIDSHLRVFLNSSKSTSLETLGVSVNGPKLLEAILNTKYMRLSGQLHPTDKHLHPSTFEIINVVGRGGRQIGFWIPKHGISKNLNWSSKKSTTQSMIDLNPIIWPGESTVVPTGWKRPVSDRKLRIGVPIKNEFQEFVKVKRNPLTNATIVCGYCIDVFEAVVQNLPYAISYEYIPFEDKPGHMAGTYNDLLYQVHLQKFDAVVGDTTILANRSHYVDFTLPYTETGVAMLVPVKGSAQKNAWIFLKPLTTDLWLGSFAAFCFTGFVVWVIEHRINTEFRGSISQQLGTIFYFAFSMLVFAHREKVHNLLSRIVVIIWLFVVLILTSSYTASLSSVLTVQDLKPTVVDVNQLIQNEDYVGYHEGSFVEAILKQHKFDESRLKAYANPDEYVEALTRGSRNGGVAAIFHSIAYIKVFLAKHCTGYTMVGPVYKTAGIGFAFPKGSPLVPDISRSILNVTEGDTMVQIENKWFGDQTACLNQGSRVISNNLTLHSFWGLFLITGTASTCALLISLSMFFYRNLHELKTITLNKSIWQRLHTLFKYYNTKDLSSYMFKRDKVIDANIAVNVNSRHTDNIEPSSNIGQQNSSISITDVSDCSSCQEEEVTQRELVSACIEAQFVPTIVTN